MVPGQPKLQRALMSTLLGGLWSSSRLGCSSTPEFVDPSARLRRLRPDTSVYSYEWFVDDPQIVEAVERYATFPVTLPHGWTLADISEPTERSEETPPSKALDTDGRS